MFERIPIWNSQYKRMIFRTLRIERLVMSVVWLWFLMLLLLSGERIDVVGLWGLANGTSELSSQLANQKER